MPGRINELGGGDGAFVDSVFIGGEFTPPVLVWRNDPHVGPSTTGEEGKNDSPVLLTVPWQPAPPLLTVVVIGFVVFLLYCLCACFAFPVLLFSAALLHRLFLVGLGAPCFTLEKLKRC